MILAGLKGRREVEEQRVFNPAAVSVNHRRGRNPGGGIAQENPGGGIPREASPGQESRAMN